MRHITLLSDFGIKDAYASIAKGILSQYIPPDTITDINHEVQPYNMAQAAYLLAASYRYFPAGTCHVLLCNMFTAGTSGLLLSECNGHYFLSSDHGLVTAALEKAPEKIWLCADGAAINTLHNWLHTTGSVLRQLQSDASIDSYFQPYEFPPMQAGNQPTGTPRGLVCDILHIDNYENIVLNITRQQLASLGQRPFLIQFTGMEEVNAINIDYNDVRAGYKLCRFNSNDYLEICINRGKAASLFGLRLGGKQNDIKIVFQ